MKCRHDGVAQPCGLCALMSPGDKLATILCEMIDNMSTSSVWLRGEMRAELTKELDDALALPGETESDK